MQTLQHSDVPQTVSPLRSGPRDAFGGTRPLRAVLRVLNGPRASQRHDRSFFVLGGVGLGDSSLQGAGGMGASSPHSDSALLRLEIKPKDEVVMDSLHPVSNIACQVSRTPGSLCFPVAHSACQRLEFF